MRCKILLIHLQAVFERKQLFIFLIFSYMSYLEHDLENTGIFPFLESEKNLAVAHKLGGDNMGLLEANRKVIETLAVA